MTEQIHVLGEGGFVFLMDLPLSAPVADRLAKGYLRRVNADGSPFAEGFEKPKPYAPKGDWVGWVVHSTADSESPVSADDADAMTKNDLIERFGVN